MKSPKVTITTREVRPGVNRVTVTGAGRTDAGVHALGMVAQVEIPDDAVKMPPSKMALAFNAFLPDDIRVMSVQRCKADFDARFDAEGKQYRYFIWNAAAMSTPECVYAVVLSLPLSLEP